MKSLTTVPSSEWKGLPRSSKAANRLGYRYYFSGERCRNGHIALSKVHHGCVVCMGLAKARADIRLSEAIAMRELDRQGPVRRTPLITKDTAEARVLVALSERGGVITQSELVDPTRRGMGKAIVSRAFASLRRKKLVEVVGGVYRVTLLGHGTAARLGAVDQKFG